MGSENPENPWFLGHVLTWSRCHNDSTLSSARSTLQGSLTAGRLNQDILAASSINPPLEHQPSQASSIQYRHPSLTPSPPSCPLTAPQNNSPKPRHHLPIYQLGSQDNHQHDVAAQDSSNALLSKPKSAAMSKAMPRCGDDIMDPTQLRKLFPHLADSTLSDSNIDATIRKMKEYRDASYLSYEDTEENADQNSKGASENNTQDASSSKGRHAGH